MPPLMLPGLHIWEYNGPALLLVNTPLLSPWFDIQGYTTLLPSFKFTQTTGTSTPSLEGSWDGLSADADLTALYTAQGAPATGVAYLLLSPWFRFKVAQGTADATVTKIFLQARI